MKKGFGTVMLTVLFLTLIVFLNVPSRVYHSGAMERMEQEMDGATQAIILRADKKLAWVLMPQMRMYMEVGYDALGASVYDPNDMDYTLVDEGPDTVAGVKTEKYRMSAVGKDGKRFEGYLWLTLEDIMVRIEAVSKGKDRTERVNMELRNLRIGPVDRSLFEVPAGYTKMQGLGNDLGGLQGLGR
ncbi:MAG: DUF4412 domain-containing protein [Deltaproteobacteria bacterium]|nr:DUF4412 domain-containing protein [Deltaproteobacteria bacterium]